ncbi:hypothetical protein [Thalassoroseus pseudoceratinae]|uniref:hypothetical protein n=1 Tax=Thalassoroseus pseudoceratinae TaxID=2713176 RepID=UPI0014222867|nr:hypothetical protein [Thalassoroseus pseudoceratinae]
MTIEPFCNDWQERRHLLVQLAQQISNGELHLVAIDEEGPMTVEGLWGVIQHLRAVELETQMHTDLEQGYINTRDQFVPHDEDWTR